MAARPPAGGGGLWVEPQRVSADTGLLRTKIRGAYLAPRLQGMSALLLVAVIPGAGFTIIVGVVVVVVVGFVGRHWPWHHSSHYQAPYCHQDGCQRLYLFHTGFHI